MEPGAVDYENWHEKENFAEYDNHPAQQLHEILE
jgi:hypothetical protein